MVGKRGENPARVARVTLEPGTSGGPWLLGGEGAVEPGAGGT